MSKSVLLPSGAELKIDVAPFVDSKNLYQVIAEEMKSLKIVGADEVDYNFLKDVFFTAVSSKKIEAALEACMKRATYKGLKIDKDTFEPVEARQDYLEACFEIMVENVSPFTIALMQKYAHLIEMIKKSFLA